MDFRPIDPRDIDTQVDSPTYRVHFWEQLQQPRIIDDAGFSAEEFELVGASDVREVIDWAEANAGPNRTFTIYAVVNGALMRLLGEDPTRLV